MPNIANMLKAEIARVSRKEIKQAIEPVRHTATKLRSDVAELKRQVAALEKENKRLRGALEKENIALPAPTQDQAMPDKGWISGKGVKSLRARLKLSQAEFAKLAGVSGKTVMTWEKQPGMLKLRQATRDALFALRGIGIREARQRLDGEAWGDGLT